VRALLLACFVAACGGAKHSCPVVEPTAPGPTFLWKASKGGRVGWVYGTIHDAGLDAVPRVAQEAFEKSERLITELGEEEPDPDVFRKHARIERGKGIDQLLPADDWWELRDALLGKIKEADLRRAKPWYAMSLLTTYSAPKPGPSMDVELTQRAGELGKSVEQFESFADQLAMLDGAVGIADLQEAIRARKTMKCDLARLVSAYRAGDIVVMEALLVVPRTKDTLLTVRNKKWFPQLDKQLAQGGVFVAVGLGHLLGDDGLVAMLLRAGYTVERVPR
jgi:uncharacterized protein